MNALVGILIGIALGIATHFLLRKFEKAQIAEAFKAVVKVLSGIEELTPEGEPGATIDEYIGAVRKWLEKWLSENDVAKLRSEMALSLGLKSKQK